MRRLLLLAAAALLVPRIATAEQIRSFESDIQLERDGHFTVEERIVYDFGGAPRHGIQRDIPVRYGRGRAADYRIALDVLSVTDENGAARPYALLSEGRNRRIRIGDAARTVTGTHEYRIRYRVRRGILWFDQRDELYWNATGNAWRVPIRRAAVTVRLPDGAEAEVEFRCFTGPQGSLRSDCSGVRQPGALRFAAERGFGAQEGLTVVVGLPKGLLEQPSRLARLLDRASDHASWVLLVPLLTFLGMGAHWWRAGRDPGGPIAIPVRYEPPEGMTPAEVGAVVDERADIDDITATILDLAVRGFLRIEELESKRFVFLQDSDYELRRVGFDLEGLKRHERELLRALFSDRRTVRVSALSGTFYRQLPGLKKALYGEICGRGKWFPADPESVRGRYLGLGLAVATAGLGLGLFGRDPTHAIAGVACGVIVAAWGRHMPRKTRRGRRARQHILGFQEFLGRVEADRLERLGLRTISQFERMLPYAFVLGAADAWADAFAELYSEPPSWFHSHRGGVFHPRGFVTDVGRSLRTAGAAMAAQPRGSGGSGSSGFGSGGGFSGGGFGGGGGGSW